MTQFGLDNFLSEKAAIGGTNDGSIQIEYVFQEPVSYGVLAGDSCKPGNLQINSDVLAIRILADEDDARAQAVYESGPHVHAVSPRADNRPHNPCVSAEGKSQGKSQVKSCLGGTKVLESVHRPCAPKALQGIKVIENVKVGINSNPTKVNPSFKDILAGTSSGAHATSISKNTAFTSLQKPCNPLPFINNFEHFQNGEAAINPSTAFLKNLRSRWVTSLSGYFLGGTYSFKYLREHAFKLWGNRGLKNAYYNSKGFYTFEFNTAQEMELVLASNTAHIGNRIMYLRPWLEGSQFVRNALPSVPVWIKFLQVPHSYWSLQGLSNIASAVGKPISFDGPTSHLEPMKFARVLVELQYSTPRPKCIWVPVLSDIDGTVLRVKVDVEYAQIPPSCSLCKAFGHALLECPNNLDANSHAKSTSSEPAKCKQMVSFLAIPNDKDNSPMSQNSSEQLPQDKDESNENSQTPSSSVSVPGDQLGSGHDLQEPADTASHDNDKIPFDDLEDPKEQFDVSNKDQGGSLFLHCQP